MNIQRVTQTGKSVRLDPLSLDHLDRLCAVGLDEELWRFGADAPLEPDRPLTTR